MKKVFTVLTSIVILCVLLSACTQKTEEISTKSPGPEASSAQVSAEKFEPFTFTDGFGREITITNKPEKIAVEHHFLVEYLVALGVQEKIVTVNKDIPKNATVFPELSKLPSIDMINQSIDFETIAVLKPDVLIVSSSLQINKEPYLQLVEKLEPNIKVIGFNLMYLEDEAETVRILGRLTGTEEAATEYINSKKAVLAMVKERVSAVPDENRMHVYYEPLQTGWTVNNQCMGVGWNIPAAGGINIASNDNKHDLQWFETDKEWLAVQNPDVVIVKADGQPSGFDLEDNSGMKTFIEQTMARPELSQSSAVKNNRVYTISDDLVRTPRSYIGVVYIAKWLYPDLFKDIDPQEIHQDYITRFLKLDYDLNQHGVFIYPGE